MFMRKILVLAFILSCGAPMVLAQSSNIEVTPFGGAKLGGKIAVNSGSVDNLLLKSSVDYGVLFDYSFWDTFQAEFMWDRQPTSLSSHNTSPSPGQPTVEKLSNINLDSYEFGILYNLRDSQAKIRPFFGGGVGFTHFGTANDTNGQSILGFGNKLSYNLGGGVKYYFDRFVGLRLDARWMPSRTTTGQGTVCDPFSGICFNVATQNHANQFPVNVGLIFRF